MRTYHPKTLWILSFGQAWDTFSYFGTQTFLVLYLIHTFHVDRTTSYSIYGAYTALAFTMPILGGIVADRWIGSKHALIAGCLFTIVGNLMMLLQHQYLFCVGLAIVLTGTGLYKSNATNLVGLLYPKGDFRKESGFTWFYLAMNVGGTMAPLAYGFIAYTLGWNYVFLGSAIGIAIGGLWFVKNWHLFDNITQPTQKFRHYNISIYAVLLVACVLISLIFYFPHTINYVIGFIFFMSLLYLVMAIKKHQGTQRKSLIAAFILCFIGMFYFAAGLQTGSTITLFIQHEIQQGIVKMQLPGSTFNMLYCLFVVLLAPCVTFLWAKLKRKNILPSAPVKLVVGITLATLGIATFAFAATTKWVLLSVVIGYLLLSAGELVITPTAYTTISNLSPDGMKSTMMGCWLLFIAMGGYFSSILANAAHAAAVKFPLGHNIYFGVFAFIALFTFAVAIIVATLIPRLVRMMD